MANSKFTDRLQEVCILILTALISAGAAYAYHNTQYDILKVAILSVISAGCMIFAVEESRIQNNFLFDNGQNLWRFMLLYFIFLLGSVVFPLLPAGGWPYLAVFTGLMLFSNCLIGMCAGSTLLMISVLLCEGSTPDLFLLYFAGGMAGVLLFSSLDENFKVGLPLFCSLLTQTVCLCLHNILMVNETLNSDMIVIPVINTLVSLILLLILLKFFSFSIIYRTRDTYMDINDPECPLLVELKEVSKDEYFHAIHTAYLCDRIAKRLNLDDAAAKAGGYYHKIGVLKGEGNFENAQLVLNEYNIPDKVMEILKEYLNENIDIVQKETVVLLFADTIISSISYLFSKNPNVSLDYDNLIETVFEKQIESGILNHSQISICDMEEMKKILVEEKLYYDFLR